MSTSGSDPTSMRIPLDPCQWASLLLLGGALTCSVSFHAIGSSVGPDGVLHEPFALIPIGYAQAAGSIGALSLSLTMQPPKQ